MKKLFSMVALAACLCAAPAAFGQEEDRSVKQKIKHAAKKTGRKTAEVASKGKAKVTDQRHKDYVGPNGETVYIDNHSRYYWVDKNGRRHYVSEEALKSRQFEVEQ